jgi:predicted nucleic acid-binding protein
LNEAVLDASVLLKWFRGEGERHLAAARALRAAFEADELFVFAPPLIRLEIVNVAGRRWGFGEQALLELAAALDELGLELREAELERVARRTARGLTAYDAAYVAVAEAEGVQLVTDDDLIVAVSPEVSIALSGAQPS